jgi:hypothetical protein
VLDQEIPLGCDGNVPTTVFDVVPEGRGRAVGRARLQVRYPGSGVIHFWSGRVEVGAPRFAYNVGDDLCPGVVATRSTMGLGDRSDASPSVRVKVHAGAAPCTDGALRIAVGSTLEVWTEDDAPGCEGKAIAAASYYDHAGVEQVYLWQTMMQPLPGVATSLTTEAPGEKLRVLGVVEGTPLQNPNQVCGAEASTLVLQTTLDGVIAATKIEVVPASQGMGHLVLATHGDVDELREVAPGPHQAAMLVGSNFTGNVTTGGCCGDGMLALIRSW